MTLSTLLPGFCLRCAAATAADATAQLYAAGSYAIYLLLAANVVGCFAKQLVTSNHGAPVARR